jgi:hypothetical protein
MLGVCPAGATERPAVGDSGLREIIYLIKFTLNVNQVGIALCYEAILLVQLKLGTEYCISRSRRTLL